MYRGRVSDHGRGLRIDDPLLAEWTVSTKLQ
jgi:hypothetical protein